MCDFCKNIETLKKIERGTLKGRCYPVENKIQIVCYDKDNSYHLWDDGGGDTFISGIELQNIRYCPYCGRELAKKC